MSLRICVLLWPKVAALPSRKSAIEFPVAVPLKLKVPVVEGPLLLYSRCLPQISVPPACKKFFPRSQLALSVSIFSSSEKRGRMIDDCVPIDDQPPENVTAGR